MAWRLESVCRQPTKTLDAWSVYEAPFDGLDAPWTRHLVGFRLEGCKGQVSSPVETFDPVSRRAVTRSGQVYELGVGPGLNADAFVVWSVWLHRQGIREVRDVSDEVAQLLRNHQQ